MDMTNNAEKMVDLQREIDKGMQDVRDGRVREWNLSDFLRRARSLGPQDDSHADKPR
jgi:hypothetical protein